MKLLRGNRLCPDLKGAAQQVDARLMEEIVRRIVDSIHPEKVILFGSRARGDARPGSDIDLLVIASFPEPRHRRSIPLYGALSDILMPMDILVYSPDEVEEWSEVRQAFVTTAIREGKVLYENQDRLGERLASESTKRSGSS